MSAFSDSTLSAEALRLEADGAVLLDNVNLQLRAGEVLGIVGPNGAGKSSLLKLLAGVLSPTAGSILLDGAPLSTRPPLMRARTLAYLEQSPYVYWPLQVEQVVALGRLPHGNAGMREARQAIEAALFVTATDKLRARTFHTLSEGEKVRVHLARVLAGTPRIVLADEPVAALDPWHQLHVLELLRTEATRGTAIAVVLHDLQHAARYCERLLVLDGGKVVAHGKPADVLSAELLAQVWRIEATIDSATLAITIHGRTG